MVSSLGRGRGLDYWCHQCVWSPGEECRSAHAPRGVVQSFPLDRRMIIVQRVS